MLCLQLLDQFALQRISSDAGRSIRHGCVHGGGGARRDGKGRRLADGSAEKVSAASAQQGGGAEVHQAWCWRETEEEAEREEVWLGLYSPEENHTGRSKAVWCKKVSWDEDLPTVERLPFHASGNRPN